MCGFIDSILVPFGVLSSQTNVIGDRREFVEFQSPLGFLLFQTMEQYVKNTTGIEFQSPLGFLFFQTDQGVIAIELLLFQSPLGFLFFQTVESEYVMRKNIGSNPLWGFCSSKHKIKDVKYRLGKFQSPLGFLFFQTRGDMSDQFGRKVPIPFGVSVLPNIFFVILEI